MAPNLLLVIVDDLRADRVGYAGLARAETPFLDELARRGVAYSRCFTTCGWTLPACASIVTGLMPTTHGLIHHDERFRAPKIPAYLGDGWASLGIGNNGNLVPDDISREELDAAGFDRRPEVWKHFGWQEGFEAYRWFHKQDKDGPFRAFTEWRAERASDDRPWFAMLHTNLVHDYDEDGDCYTDVERFLGRPVPEPLRKFRDGPWVWRERPDGMSDADVRDVLLAKYDGGVAEFDRRLRETLADVDFDDTVVVVVSDHGEGFDGERERVHHCGRLHDDLLRVPLIVVYPPGTEGAPEPGTVVDRACSTIDVAPTLLRIAGVGTGDLAGADLRELPTDRPVYAEDLGYLYLPPGSPAERLRRFEYKRYRVENRAVVRWPMKSIEARIGHGGWHEEYDLELDPLERVNRATGPQRPQRRPQRDEGALKAMWRAARATGDEADLVRFPSKYARWARSLGKRRRLPEVRPHRPFAEIENAEPITFLVAVDDPDELRRHALVSECYLHGGHQWLFVENGGNRAYSSISELYADATARAEHDLRFYVHQDVLFPPDWEDRLFAALRDLEARDPNWGVIGAAGRAPRLGNGSEPPNIGHWSDPHKYHKPPKTGLPAEVQVLDELWLGVRASRGVAFDRGLPGFHCYGADLCMTARDAGMKSYVIDAPVIHKLVLPDGTLIETSDQSHKIEGRRTDAFRADFLRSANYVAGKWEQYLPFQSTCHAYDSAE